MTNFDDKRSVDSIVIDINSQTLTADFKSGEQQRYLIASAKNGIGQRFGSECTPLGRHIVRAKIGADQLPNTVFVARRPTGEIYTPELGASAPDRDWILSRILWLSGTQSGHNRLGNVDTMRRFIYIHGAPDSHAMGQPSSHGCIKMRNADIIQLFDRVAVGTPVFIQQ